MDVRFPIGELELPEKVTMNDINQWLDEIGNYANRLRKVVDGLNDEALKKNTEKVVGQLDSLSII